MGHPRTGLEAVMSGYTVVPNASRPRQEACRFGPGTGNGHQVQDHRTGSGHQAHGHGTGSGSVDERISSVRHRCVPNRSRGRAAGCNSVGLVVCVEPDQRQFRHYGHHVPVWREILPFRWFQPAPHCPANGDARQCGRAQAHIFFESRHRTLKSGYTQYLTESNQCGRARPAGVHGGHGRFFNAATTKDQPALVIAAAIGGLAGLFTDQVLKKMRSILALLPTNQTASDKDGANA